MFEFQNTQLQLISLESMKLNILKFCYFMMWILFVACAKKSSEKIPVENQNESATEQTETKITTMTDTKTILCFGDSITAGYGLDDSNDAYPAVLQQKIDALGLDYTVINSGLSGETSAGGKGRIDWTLNQDIDIFLLELGANDGLRGVPLSETRVNLQAIINAIDKKNPNTKIILAGMELPPNMGQDYTKEFRKIFKELAENNNLELIPFILNDVGGIAELNQGDGIHPTVEGHKIIANTIWETLKTLL